MDEFWATSINEQAQFDLDETLLRKNCNMTGENIFVLLDTESWPAFIPDPTNLRKLRSKRRVTGQYEPLFGYFVHRGLALC